MKITATEMKEFIDPIQEILTQEQVSDMMNYIQHGNTTTFTHCLVVAYYSYVIALRLPMKLDTNSITRGAMLHDFYLYDWHIPHESHKLHGFVHPKFALHNARKYFKLNSIEEDIIEKHMWPLTLHKPPKSKEAMLVNLVDKVCSLGETLYLPILPKEYRQLHRLILSKN